MADRLEALSVLLNDEFGTAFRFYDGSTGESVIPEGAGDWQPSPARITPGAIRAIALEGRPQVGPSGTDRHRLILPLRGPEGPALVAMGEIAALARSPHDFQREQARLLKWVQAVHGRLSSPVRPPAPPRADESKKDQLSLSLGAMLELNELLRGVPFSEEPSAYQEQILDRVEQVLTAETIVWVPDQPGDPILIRGEGRLSSRDCGQLAELLSQHAGWDPSGCVILNEVDSIGLGARFPSVLNILAVSVRQHGQLIAVNKRDSGGAERRLPAADSPSVPAVADPHSAQARPARPAVVPFRRFDAALLMPFGALLGIQASSSRRQVQLQELFVGLIRSLITAIDAKDAYTFGHSERVARVAVELGRELGLSEAELSDIYLGGLLHDIGKIGVSDTILRKAEPLTAHELDQIRQHVVIGRRIIADFGAISHLFPLVLYHHERYDGQGYPEGLKGEAIPLAARILAVADSYDAMNSTRAYRSSLPRGEIEDILAHGRDIQWDGQVIDAFFRARDRIYGIRQQGIGESICLALDKDRKVGHYRIDVGHREGSGEPTGPKLGTHLIAIPNASRPQSAEPGPAHVSTDEGAPR